MNRDTRSRDTRNRVHIGMLLLALGVLLTLGARFSGAANEAAEDGAVKHVVAGFSDGWNIHDAAMMCASLADDVRWVSWRGEVFASRKEVEDAHAKLFADLYKNTHRTDEVKSIRYVGA